MRKADSLVILHAAISRSAQHDVLYLFGGNLVNGKGWVDVAGPAVDTILEVVHSPGVPGAFEGADSEDRALPDLAQENRVFGRIELVDAAGKLP